MRGLPDSHLRGLQSEGTAITLAIVERCTGASRKCCRLLSPIVFMQTQEDVGTIYVY